MIGDGVVGLLVTPAAGYLGAERIIAMSVCPVTLCPKT